MSKQYQKGYRLERELVNQYREKGWLAFRSAGSHSPIDIFAINPETYAVHLIQVKNEELTPKQLAKIIKDIGLKPYGAGFVEVFVAHRVKGEKGIRQTPI